MLFWRGARVAKIVIACRCTQRKLSYARHDQVPDGPFRAEDALGRAGSDLRGRVAHRDFGCWRSPRGVTQQPVEPRERLLTPCCEPLCGRVSGYQPGVDIDVDVSRNVDKNEHEAERGPARDSPNAAPVA